METEKRRERLDTEALSSDVEYNHVYRYGDLAKLVPAHSFPGGKND